MTDNMELMWHDMAGSIIHSYDEDALRYLFFDDFTAMTYESFIDYMLLEFIKYSYDETTPKHPLRYFVPCDSSNNTERMMYSRTLKYIQRFRNQNYKVLKDTKELDEDDPILLKLKGKSMDSIEARKEGYELTEMTFFEANTIHDLQIVKSISEKRIYTTKKVSNSTFIDYFIEYDKWVEKLIERSKKSDEDMVFASLAFFTLEWKYSLEYFYELAEYMIGNDLDEIDYYTAWLFTGTFNFDSSFGISVGTDSRIIVDRKRLISTYYNKSLTGEKLDDLRHKYIEILTIKSLTIKMPCFDGGDYIDWFKNNTSIADWASFFKEYNVFQIWKRKEFTNEKIRKMRYILELTSCFRRADLENPDFRA